MAGEAKITIHDRYVLVSVKGEPLLPQEIKSKLVQAVKKAIESQLSIIINREVPVKQHASVIDFYYYAEFLGGYAFLDKLALVFPEEMHHDNLDFFESAARNRGINLKLFSKMEDALHWIEIDTNDK